MDRIDWLLRECLDTKELLIDDCPRECERYNPPAPDSVNNFNGLKCKCRDLYSLGHLEFALLYILRNTKDQEEYDKVLDKIVEYYSNVIDKYDPKSQ